MTTVTEKAAAEKATHTPGPWKVSHSGYANAPFVIFSGDKTPNYRSKFPLSGINAIAEVFSDESEQHEEQNANARLIAAAPDLLLALKVIVAQLAGTCVSDAGSGDACIVSVREARLVIAQAEAGR